MQPNNILEKIKKIKPSVNLDRPKYVQPEDSFIYRSSRILLILGFLSTSNGLSKKSIACLDFLLKNSGYQERFLLEYYKEDSNKLLKIFNKYSPADSSETDFNLIQYKNIPWDLRFNDIFYFLYTRKLIEFIGKQKNRAKITNLGLTYFQKLKTIFKKESKFLEIFGKTIKESKTEGIISNVIPEVYWKENEKSIYQ